jgi:hypothetical protein
MIRVGLRYMTANDQLFEILLTLTLSRKRFFNTLIYSYL